MACIHHVALWANDIERVCAFYADAFGATVGPRYENPSKGFTSRFVTFDDGARLEVMASTRLDLGHPEPGRQRLGFIHVAVSVGSEAAVTALAAKLGAQGVPVLDGPRRTGDGYFECVVLDPEGHRVEITV